MNQIKNKIEEKFKEEQIGKICGKIQTRIINSEEDIFKPITESERKKVNRECFKEGYKQAQKIIDETLNDFCEELIEEMDWYDDKEVKNLLNKLKKKHGGKE